MSFYWQKPWMRSMRVFLWTSSGLKIQSGKVVPMGNDKLQRQQTDLSVASGTSLTDSCKTLAVQMHLTTLNAKSEPEEELVAEFGRVFAKESPVVIEWVFRTWREQSQFFPAIADILKLVKEWRRGERERKELEKGLKDKFLLEEGRKQGQVPELVEIFQQLKDVAMKTMDVPTMQREAQFRERIQRVEPTIIPPAVRLTAEQIEARRSKEQAEIHQYEVRQQQTDGMYEPWPNVD